MFRPLWLLSGRAGGPTQPLTPGPPASRGHSLYPAWSPPRPRGPRRGTAGGSRRQGYPGTGGQTSHVYPVADSSVHRLDNIIFKHK